MATAWYLTDYVRKDRAMRPGRVCRMNTFTPQIEADGGRWREIEVLGGYAVVKVRASAATLTTIAETAGILRLPVALLTSPLSDLTNAQRQAILDRLEAMGYTREEVLARLGNNIRNKTLADVLRFAASRRRKPRYDAIADVIVMDGEIVGCESVDDADLEITED